MDIIVWILISALFVALNLYLDVFHTGFDWSAVQYAYSSKNSVSQILFTAIVIILATVIYNNKIITTMKWLIAFFFTLLLFI